MICTTCNGKLLLHEGYYFCTNCGKIYVCSDKCYELDITEDTSARIRQGCFDVPRCPECANVITTRCPFCHG